MQVGEYVWRAGQDVAAAVEVDDDFLGGSRAYPVRAGAVSEDLGAGCQVFGLAEGGVGRVGAGE